MKKSHKKKMVGPILVTVFFILIMALYGVVYIVLPIPVLIKLIAGGILLVFIIWIICTMCQRIKEIKGGEDDDLNNY